MAPKPKLPARSDPDFPFSASDKDFRAFLVRATGCTEDDAYAVVALMQGCFLRATGPVSPTEVAAIPEAMAATAFGEGMSYEDAGGVVQMSEPRLLTLFVVAKDQSAHAVRLHQAQELAQVAPQSGAAGAAHGADVLAEAMSGLAVGERKAVKPAEAPPMSPYLTGRTSFHQPPAALLRWWQTKIDNLDIHSPDNDWPFHGPLLGDKPSSTPRLDGLSTKQADYKGTCVFGASPHPPAHLDYLEPAVDAKGMPYFANPAAFLATHALLCEVIACCIKGGSSKRPTPAEALKISHGGDEVGLIEPTPRFFPWPVMSAFHASVERVAVKHGLKAAEAYDRKVRDSLSTHFNQSRGRLPPAAGAPVDDKEIAKILTELQKDILDSVLKDQKEAGTRPAAALPDRDKPKKPPTYNYGDRRTWGGICFFHNAWGCQKDKCPYKHEAPPQAPIGRPPRSSDEGGLYGGRPVRRPAFPVALARALARALPVSRAVAVAPRPAFPVAPRAPRPGQEGPEKVKK